MLLNKLRLHTILETNRIVNDRVSLYEHVHIMGSDIGGLEGFNTLLTSNLSPPS